MPRGFPVHESNAGIEAGRLHQPGIKSEVLNRPPCFDAACVHTDAAQEQRQMSQSAQMNGKVERSSTEAQLGRELIPEDLADDQDPRTTCRLLAIL